MDVHGTKLARTLFTGSTPVASASVAWIAPVSTRGPVSRYAADKLR